MKLIAIIVCRCPRSSQELGFLSAAYDLSGYAFYQRNTVKEGLKFIARTAIPRLPVGSQQEVEHEGSVAFVYRYPDSLAILAIGDREYPRRVAFACLNEVHADFTRSVSMPVWVRAGSQGAAAKSSTSNHPDVHYRDRLAELLKKYKNPMQSDELVRALQKAEQAQEVVRQTISTVLRHGESLQELVNRSEDLSSTSKQLFKSTTKVKNSFGCCRVQ
ncbi:hypothetical protein Emed_002950 [Eimeria media]